MEMRYESRGRDDDAENILFLKPEGKIIFDRPWTKWSDIVRKIRYEGLDWIHMAQHRSHADCCEDSN